jgi:Tol biopolymer transport system component
MMEADGTNPINLSNHPAEDFSPAWSPDGTLIAFSTNRDGNWEIYALNVETGEITNITKNDWEDWFPAWQPPPSPTSN